jgi:hypothetical protein
LTTSDIGKTYTDTNTGITWVLVKIISTNVIEICAYSNTNWWKMQAATVPATLNFGSSLTVSSNSRKQLYPSVKNGSAKLITNTSEDAVFVETYDIIDAGTGLDAIISNVGSNTNDSIVDLSDVVCTVKNLYDFKKNGVVIVKGNVVSRKAGRTLSHYGGVQSQAFGDTDLFAVPMTNYRTLQANNGQSISLPSSVWTTQNKPPFIYEQSNSGKTEMFFTGYIADESERSAILTDGAGQYNASHKMYPYFTSPVSALPVNDSINFVAFRVPSHKNEISASVPFVSYWNDNNESYMLVKTLENTTASVQLPVSLCGKNVQIIMSEHITTSTEIVVDSLDIVSYGEGTLLVKIF